MSTVTLWRNAKHWNEEAITVTVEDNKVTRSINEHGNDVELSEAEGCMARQLVANGYDETGV